MPRIPDDFTLYNGETKQKTQGRYFRGNFGFSFQDLTVKIMLHHNGLKIRLEQGSNKNPEPCAGIPLEFESTLVTADQIILSWKDLKLRVDANL